MSQWVIPVVAMAASLAASLFVVALAEMQIPFELPKRHKPDARAAFLPYERSQHGVPPPELGTHDLR